MIRYAILLCLVCCSASSHAGRKVTDTFRLYVDDYKDGRRVAFWSRNSDGWPADCKGFWIVRKAAGTDEWERLNRQLLYPRTSADFDPATMMSAAPEMKRLKERMPEALEGISRDLRGLFALPAGTDLREKCRSMGASPAVLCIALNIDPDFVFYCNMGIYDTSAKKGAEYLYGLLPEYADRKVAEPEIVFDTRLATLDQYTVDAFEGELEDGEMRIEWRKNIRASALRGYDVYRKESEDGEFKRIGTNPGFIKGDVLSFVYYDDSVPNKFEGLYYKFVPIHKFGKKIDAPSYWTYEKKK